MPASLVCSLVSKHGGEMFSIERLDCAAGEHNRRTSARKAPGGGLVVINDDGAEIVVHATCRSEPAPVTATGQPGKGQRAGSAPAHPASNRHGEQRSRDREHMVIRIKKLSVHGDRARADEAYQA